VNLRVKNLRGDLCMKIASGTRVFVFVDHLSFAPGQLSLNQGKTFTVCFCASSRVLR
jgi:hypothetical protein